MNKSTQYHKQIRMLSTEERWHFHGSENLYCETRITNALETPTASIFRVDDVGSRFLQNVGNHLHVYMVYQPRSSQLKNANLTFMPEFNFKSAISPELSNYQWDQHETYTERNTSSYYISHYSVVTT
jgi:hypothetical protein